MALIRSTHRISEYTSSRRITLSSSRQPWVEPLRNRARAVSSLVTLTVSALLLLVLVLLLPVLLLVLGIPTASDRVTGHGDRHIHGNAMWPLWGGEKRQTLTKMGRYPYRGQLRDGA
eukprot:3044667-Rhodomonas_salina.2